MVRKGRRSRGNDGGGASDSGLIAEGKSKKFTEEDMSDDEVDAFHDQRDEIIFNGAGKRSKSANNQNPFDALATDSRSVLDVNQTDSQDSDEDEQNDQQSSQAPNAQQQRKKKEYKKKPTTQISLPNNSSDDDDVEDASDAQEDEQDFLTGSWGSNKKSYYNTNDLDDLEPDSEMDEEEKREMELREVKKLQSRSRQGMLDDDFGLGDQSINAESGQAAREQRKRDLDVDIPVNQQEQTATPVNPAELIAKVQREKPELMALIGEYADMVDDMHVASNRMKMLQETNPEHSSLGLLHLHHQTLLSYVTSLTFYFYVSALRYDDARVKSSKASDSIQTRIIERLAKLKQGLSSLDDFGLGLEEEEEANDGIEDEENDENQAPQFLFKPYGIMSADDDSDDGSVSLGSLEEDELMQLDAEERSAEASQPNHDQKRAEEAEINVQKPAKVDKKKKQNKQYSNISPPAPLAGLADILNGEVDNLHYSPPAKRRKQAERITDSAYDEYSEPTALSTVDEAEKDAKRRSLKFHTGHLDALDSRKKNVRQLDGDVDIPYRDKERSRLAVASTNANKSAKVNGNDVSRRQLDTDDFGEADAKDYREVMDSDSNLVGKARGLLEKDDGDEDYYDLITSSRKAAKEAKKADYDQQRAAERFVPDGTGLEAGEHRSINRQIEKNRGLTPRRPKTARNPRVKKRQRYEEAQKKLSSRGPVYKGGQSSLQGGYGGEKSGISTHVVKSRQFA